MGTFYFFATLLILQGLISLRGGWRRFIVEAAAARPTRRRLQRDAAHA